MTKMSIKLSTIDDVRAFVNTVSKYDFEVDLQSGRYLVDAKSIMGIFSLDLMNPIEMTIHSDSADALVKDVQTFVVK